MRGPRIMSRNARVIRFRSGFDPFCFCNPARINSFDEVSSSFDEVSSSFDEVSSSFDELILAGLICLAQKPTHDATEDTLSHQMVTKSTLDW